MDSFTIQTRERTSFIDSTDDVRRRLKQNGLRRGICVVYCPQTTAAITINENADPDVVHDMLAWLNRTIPQQQRDFRHAEGNSDAHIKSSLVGASATVLVESSALVLGRWQGIYFCEFDGPRTRQVNLQFIES